MAYGTRDGTRFTGKPGSKLENIQYYLIVEDASAGENAGNITIKSLSITGDRTVGTIPRGGTFIYNPGTTTSQELQYFSKETQIKEVRNQAEITVKKALVKPKDEGGAGQNANAASFNARTLVQGPQQGPTPNGQTLDSVQQQSAGASGAAAAAGSLKKFELSEKLTAKEGTREDFPKNLSYPENMSSQQDKLKIDMLKFSPRKFNLGKLTFGERDIRSTIGSVVLAIPGGITDDNRVNWGSADMDAGEAALAMFALDVIKNGGDAIGAFGKSIQDLATNPGVSKELQTGFAAFFAGQAAGVKGLLARTEGAVLNPNTELLFQGPALRAFTFNFKLSPRSEKEAVMVRSIIRFFKQGMAVQRTDSELFLKAPHIFKLTFLKGEKETHAFLPQFKLCALLNCSVNYTPEGNYATFKDSSMVSYEMSLTFNELDPIFNDEYPTDGDATIGF